MKIKSISVLLGMFLLASSAQAQQGPIVKKTYRMKDIVQVRILDNGRYFVKGIDRYDNYIALIGNLDGHGNDCVDLFSDILNTGDEKYRKSIAVTISSDRINQKMVDHGPDTTTFVLKRLHECSVYKNVPIKVFGPGATN